MPSAIVLAGPKNHSAFIRDVLRAKGWKVAAPDVASKAPVDAAGVDLILVDLGFAIAERWLDPEHGAKPPAPLVVMSRFGVFLEKIRPDVAGIIHLPATEEAVLGAAEGALRAAGRARPPALHLSSTAIDPLDSAARDHVIETCILSQVDLDAELSSIANLVARSVGVSIGVISIVTSRMQSFLGQCGMPDDLIAAGGTVRSWAFCQHVVREGAPLIVEDAREFPVLKDTPLVTTGLVRAYAGYPIEVDGIGPVGAVCALSPEPHVYSETDRVTIELGARLVGEVFARRLRSQKAPDSPSPAPPADPASSKAAPSLLIGELLDDKYWITAALGRGGQSRVYLARDRMFGQLVAIKVNPRHFEPMLIREGETLATIRHPNIVQLHGWGRTPSGEIYVVIEYVRGETLQTRIEAAATGEPMSPSEVAEIVGQIAGALASMHALGFVHGDVKPLNILLDVKLDRAVLIDFGLGYMLNKLGDPTFPILGGGTVGYSAPEQFASGERLSPSPAYDIYALAAVTFAMLTGSEPFAGQGGEQLDQQRRGDVALLSSFRAELSPKVEALINRALSPDPAQRPESVLAFSEALRKALREQGRRQPASAPPGRVPRSRGEVFTMLRSEVHRLMGPAGELRTFAKLLPGEREVFTEVTDPSKLYIAAPLVSYLRAFTDGDLARLRPLSASLARDALRDAIRQLRIAWTPETVLSVAPGLLRRYHAWGQIQVKRTASNAARIKLDLPDGFAPVMCWHLTYVLEALLSATSRDSEVTQSSCVAEGAPACVVEARWAEAEGVLSRRDVTAPFTKD
jgi:serine/threonine protein kinase